MKNSLYLFLLVPAWGWAQCNPSGAPSVFCTAAQTKTFLAITTSDITGLGTLATQNTVPATALPAFTGAITTTAGSSATSFGSAILPSANISGSYTGITGVGTLTSGTVPSSLVTGLGTLATQSGTFSGTSSGTNTGDQTITLTGGVTGSGTGSFAATVASVPASALPALTGAVTSTVGSAATSFGSTVLPSANLSGSYTGITGVGTLSAGAIPVSLVTGLGTLATQSGTFSGTTSGTNTGDQTITLTGGVTGSGTGTFAATVASVPAAALPAFTGDCTTTAGAVALTCTSTNGAAFGTFATQNYATPPAIGATTANAGTFTTITAKPAANSYSLISTGGSLTSGATGLGVDITGTVNDATAVDGIVEFANIICTACAATSYLVDYQVGGTSEFKIATNGAVTSNGGYVAGSTSNFAFNGRGNITSSAANNIQIGGGASGSPSSQTLATQGSIGGTSTNVAGGNLTIQSGAGTGSATGSTLALATPHATTTGTTQQTFNTQILLGDNTITLNNPVTLPVTTVAGLPTCSTSVNYHAMAAVSDATTPTYNGTLTGGSTVYVPVFCNGTAWTSH